MALGNCRRQAITRLANGNYSASFCGSPPCPWKKCSEHRVLQNKQATMLVMYWDKNKIDNNVSNVLCRCCAG